jgi:uncharacterized protein (DUF488 family)
VEDAMTLWTIGFTKKTAAEFFGILRKSGAKRVVDVRLNNVSQLAAFAKKEDLKYFLREICAMDYEHVPLLAPTQEMLDTYKKKKGGWAKYEQEFSALLRKRKIEFVLKRELLADSCLLCSEDTPEHCHRRLVAEYLQKHWGSVDIVHL